MEKFAQCLSPVHIGTGVKLAPFDYIADGTRYIRVNQEAFIGRLSEEQAEALTDWVSERADRSELRREFNLLSFADKAQAQALSQALKTDKELAQYEGKGSLDRSSQVFEQLKDADATPLIPGSSIKGAIRTALAFLALKEMAKTERKKVAGEVERGLQIPRRFQERIGQELEKAIFRWGQKAEDIHCDLMRGVSISDSIALQAELVVPQIYTFVEAKAERRQAGERRLQSQTPLIAEAHAPGNTFRLRVRLDGQLLQAIWRHGKPKEHQQFAERVARAFGPEAIRLLTAGAEPKELEAAIWQRIEKACQAFAAALIEAEEKWAETFRVEALIRFYQQLGQLNDKAVLLRLGWGSQFSSTTLFLALREDENWKPVLERCFRVFNLGVPPPRDKARDNWQERKVDLDFFPRSRRLAAVDKRPVAPFGWIALADGEAALPGALVAVDDLIGKPPEGQRRRGEGISPRRESPESYAPPRRQEPPLPKPKPKIAEKAKGPRRGERVNATVLAVEGHRVRVKLESGEELAYEQPFARVKPGDSVKVKVESVDAQGKVTKVIP